MHACVQDKPNDGELDQRLYGDGKSFVTLLPNRTGQCKYKFFYYRKWNTCMYVYFAAIDLVTLLLLHSPLMLVC